MEVGSAEFTGHPSIVPQNADSGERSPGQAPITTAPRVPDLGCETVALLGRELRVGSTRGSSSRSVVGDGSGTSADGVSGSSNGQFTCTGPGGSPNIASSASRAAWRHHESWPSVSGSGISIAARG